MSDMSKKILISFKNVRKHFPKGTIFKKQYLRAVDDVSFDLYEGEITAVVGESGCGKTTLARMLTKLTAPTAGEIFVDGQDITKPMSRQQERTFRSKVQMIFQDPFGSLNPAHTVSYIVGRGLEIHNKGISKAKVNEKVKELFETVGLTPAEDYMEKHPNQLSGGQRQRIVIARALAVSPQIIVADEPTSMLDVSIGIDIMNLMLELKEKKRLTYMYITHNLASARYIAERIVVMYAGNCVETGLMDEIISQPYHPYTLLLLSSTPEPFREERYEIFASEDLPDLVSENKSCLFCSRCPWASHRCKTEVPPDYTINNRRVKCFLYENATDGEPRVDVSKYTVRKDKP